MIYNSIASLSVAIWINRTAHLFISVIVIKQCGDLSHNTFKRSTDEFYSSCRNCLWPFGSIAHHKYRNSQAWCFFLNTT